jgi:hypothetical protein
MSYPCSILPIGTVNLLTGKCQKGALFDTVFDCWKPNSVACVLLSVSGLATTKFLVVVTSDSLANATGSHPSGKTLRFKHDQTGREYPGVHTVAGVFSHDATGHKAMATAAGARSIAFATYK